MHMGGTVSQRDGGQPLLRSEPGTPHRGGSGSRAENAKHKGLSARGFFKTDFKNKKMMMNFRGESP